MRGARRFISREKQVFLVDFSLTFPRFPQKSQNRLNSTLLRIMRRFNLLYLPKYFCSFRGPFGKIGLSIGIVKVLFLPFDVLIKSCLSRFFMNKTSMGLPFQVHLQVLSEGFSCCLEQLFSREPVSTCLWKKELHSRRYLRSFKNRQGWNPQFPGLNFWEGTLLEVTFWNFL